MRRLPITCTLTSLVAPSAVSVTVHTEPAGIPSKLRDTRPARVLAAITKSGDSAVPLQATPMVTGPWRPASGPAMVLLTSRDPLDATFDARHRAGKRRAVAVADVHFDDVTGRDGHRLPASVDDDRHRAGVPVSGFRDRALRRSSRSDRIAWSGRPRESRRGSRSPGSRPCHRTPCGSGSPLAGPHPDRRSSS